MFTVAVCKHHFIFTLGFGDTLHVQILQITFSWFNVHEEAGRKWDDHHQNLYQGLRTK